jgi:hypothetical protein
MSSQCYKEKARILSYIFHYIGSLFGCVGDANFNNCSKKKRGTSVCRQEEEPTFDLEMVVHEESPVVVHEESPVVVEEDDMACTPKKTMKCAIRKLTPKKKLI